MILSALFIALGIVLPSITMHVPSIGNMLCPMHIPVLLCGFICGPIYGALIGFILPLLRSTLFGMPMMFPTAIAMAFELTTYGFCTGFLFRKTTKNTLSIYVSLILSMLLGRIVWGIASAILYSMAKTAFGIQLFIAGAFLKAIPGILIQLILIPIIIIRLQKNHFIHD